MTSSEWHAVSQLENDELDAIATIAQRVFLEPETELISYESKGYPFFEIHSGGEGIEWNAFMPARGL